jgi:ribose transport system permease protein
LGAEFRAIPAAVIGGASLMGGQGNIVGPMLGVLLLALINDALILLGVSSYYQGLAQGLVLLLAVTIDALVHRER